MVGADETGGTSVLLDPGLLAVATGLTPIDILDDILLVGEYSILVVTFVGLVVALGLATGLVILVIAVFRVCDF